MVMTSPLLIALILCLTAFVLWAQELEEMESDVDTLDKELQQGCSTAIHARDRLKQLEENLARQEKQNFTGSMIEAYVFKFMPEHFRGLNLSSRMDASNATCVFWQPGDGANSTGSWSREGCETTHGEGIIICHCNHLTYFAVLLIPAGALSPAQLASLTYISTIGCSLSAAAILCTLALCCFFRRWLKDNTTRIHMHLLAALLLLNCSFLLSTPLAAGSEGLCQVAAALLHAGLLCALAWMAAEAFHLLLLLVKVYNIYIQHYLLKLCLFAWGLPMLAVVAIFVFKRDTYGYHNISSSEGYRNMTTCWLTSQPAHYATICCAGLILLFNTLVLGRVMIILWRIQRQKEQARKDWVTVLVLTCLLGTTWGLAFFSFGVFLVPQLYLFTILNSLQGFFICLWYITLHRQSKLGSVTNTFR
ncbi:adhesion G-protein coupled receptor G5 isoform X4 [Cuculus canorus]|uniref:adhesion G-protein coupled receptor G5 isoform X4 n=1 Tax=Cuculus canorus TaxID=55661 RepID=UPI0023AAC44F|nr:adhesion G-protein coupled receptor G5 isoform X4 [Cuculus canorus]